MIAQVNAGTFREALGVLAHVVSMARMIKIPGADAIVIRPGRNGLSLEASSNELMARVVVEGDVTDGEPVGLPGQALIGLARQCSGNVEIIAEAGQVQLVSGTMRASLSSVLIDGVPNLPDEPEHWVKRDAVTFRRAVTSVAYAAAKDHITPVLSAVCLRGCSVIATDGYRLAVYTLPVALTEEDILFSDRALKIVMRYMPYVETFQFGVAGSHAVFRLGHRTFWAGLIAGEYPDIDSFIANQTREVSGFIRVDKNAFKRALSSFSTLVSLKAIKEIFPVTFTPRESKLKLSADIIEVQLEQVIDAEIEGIKDDSKWELSFLLEAIGPIEQDVMTLKMYAKDGYPLAMCGIEEGPYKALIMTIRRKGENE